MSRIIDKLLAQIKSEVEDIEASKSSLAQKQKVMSALQSAIVGFGDIDNTNFQSFIKHFESVIDEREIFKLPAAAISKETK